MVSFLYLSTTGESYFPPSITHQSVHPSVRPISFPDFLLLSVEVLTSNWVYVYEVGLMYMYYSAGLTLVPMDRILPVILPIPLKCVCSCREHVLHQQMHQHYSQNAQVVFHTVTLNTYLYMYIVYSCTCTCIVSIDCLSYYSFLFSIEFRCSYVSAL